MVEPVTILVAVTTVFSLFSMGINWFKKTMDTQSPSPVPLSTTTPMPQLAMLPSSTNEDIQSIFKTDYRFYN